MWAGTTHSVSLTATDAAASDWPAVSTSNTVGPSAPGVTPTWSVAWACGSRSIRQTFLPARDRATARFTDVVVLPTPPF